MKAKDELISFCKEYKSCKTGIWANNERQLVDSVLYEDIHNFLNWDVLLNTMVIGNKPYVQYELDYLKSLSDWERWKEVLYESVVGVPILYKDTNLSGNIIHQACHAALFEQTANVDIENLDYIFEFGGGYGCMCRLIHNLGFKGTYVIFDLPVFNALQKYYLKETGIYNDKICLVSKLQQTVLNNFKRNSLFIATWSLSESRIDTRHFIARHVIDRCQYALLAYQKEFEGIKNKEYFDNYLVNDFDFEWYESDIEYLPGSTYLFGGR